MRKIDITLSRRQLVQVLEFIEIGAKNGYNIFSDETVLNYFETKSFFGITVKKAITADNMWNAILPIDPNGKFRSCSSSTLSKILRNNLGISEILVVLTFTELGIFDDWYGNDISRITRNRKVLAKIFLPNASSTETV